MTIVSDRRDLIILFGGVMVIKKSKEWW